MTFENIEEYLEKSIELNQEEEKDKVIFYDIDDSCIQILDLSSIESIEKEEDTVFSDYVLTTKNGTVYNVSGEFTLITI